MHWIFIIHHNLQHFILGYIIKHVQFWTCLTLSTDGNTVAIHTDVRSFAQHEQEQDLRSHKSRRSNKSIQKEQPQIEMSQLPKQRLQKQTSLTHIPASKEETNQDQSKTQMTSKRRSSTSEFTEKLHSPATNRREQGGTLENSSSCPVLDGSDRGEVLPLHRADATEFLAEDDIDGVEGRGVKKTESSSSGDSSGVSSEVSSSRRFRRLNSCPGDLYTQKMSINGDETQLIEEGESWVIET